jgi:hypothetical protein
MSKKGGSMTPEIQGQLHELLLTVLTGVVTVLGFLVRNLISAQIDKIKSQSQQAMAKRLVAYAEQKISGSIQKNTFAANAISAKFPELSADEVQHLIEQAVVSIQTPAAIVQPVTYLAPAVTPTETKQPGGFSLIQFVFLLFALSTAYFIVPAHAASWWERTFNTAPNLAGNFIYAPNFQNTYADLETVLWVPKINGNPINLSAVYVPSTDIGGMSIGYDLSNLPQGSVDTGLLACFNVTLAAGFVYSPILQKGSLSFSAQVIKIKFE